MKKEMLRFVAAIATLCAFCSIVLYLTPAFAGRISNVDSFLLGAETPAEFVQSKKEEFSENIASDTGNDIITASEGVTSAESTTEVMNRIISKDSNDNSNLTETPSDVKALMDEAQKTIASEKIIGKTSEEPYFGGGTLVKFGNVEVQKKIPDSFYKLNIKKLLSQKPDLKIKDKSKPVVLIYHSHTTESYTLLDAGYYTESCGSRSKNCKKNMVRVGEEIVKVLESKGFSVIHDKEIHDLDYNSAYDDSRKSVEKYLEQYPSIDITIDVHRDDITYKDKTKVKPTAVVNGKKAARMMIIAGCQYDSITNYPDWEYNLRFDLAVQKKIASKYSDLMRPVLFSARRYNMFETHNSFLLEIGTHANTLDEACYSARLFGDAFGDFLEEYVTED